MTHTQILNDLIAGRNYQSYLEIGLGDGRNFQAITATDKVGVDPTTPGLLAGDERIHPVGSNDFFSGNKRTFDLIFVDGLHRAGQVKTDIEESLKILNPGGAILVHDCNPPTESSQMVPRAGRKVWCGDVWKAWVELRRRGDINQVCIDTDFGCGFIQRGSQAPLDITGDLSYERLDSNRPKWLNLISVEDFQRKYLKPVPSEALIYSINFGSYDYFLPPPLGDFTGVYITDQPGQPHPDWGQIKAVDPPPDPKRTTGFYKTLCWEAPPHQISICMDGSVQPKPNFFELLDHFRTSGHDIMIPRHPHRMCLYDEARACIDLKKDPGGKIPSQIKKYRDQGVPKNLGMVATGIIFRKNNPITREFNRIWWQEIQNGSARDQISVMVAARQSGVSLWAADFNIYNNKYFHIHPHRHWKRKRVPR